MRIQYFIKLCQDKLVSFFKYVNISYKFESNRVLKVHLSKSCSFNPFNLMIPLWRL